MHRPGCSFDVGDRSKKFGDAWRLNRSIRLQEMPNAGSVRMPIVLDAPALRAEYSVLLMIGVECSHRMRAVGALMPS